MNYYGAITAFALASALTTTHPAIGQETSNQGDTFDGYTCRGVNNDKRLIDVFWNASTKTIICTFEGNGKINIPVPSGIKQFGGSGWGGPESNGDNDCNVADLTPPPSPALYCQWLPND